MTDLCQDCGSSVAWGSGKYVNRIPADNGWLCVDCQCVECDKCHKDHGVGLGTGRGQKFVKQDDERWLKVAG